MKRLHIIAINLILFLLPITLSTGQAKNSDAMTIMVPAESIARTIKPLLPYKIDFGKNFSGSLWIKSIKNIKIKKDRITFSLHIYGKDIQYSTKIGNQAASFAVGNVNLQNHWEASLSYDKIKKRLFIKPHIKGLGNKKDLSQGDILLNTLFEALSDIEYPIEVNKLKPITSEFYDKLLTVNMDISDVYTDKNKLVIEIIPTARIDAKKQL